MRILRGWVAPRPARSVRQRAHHRAGPTTVGICQGRRLYPSRSELAGGKDRDQDKGKLSGTLEGRDRVAAGLEAVGGLVLDREQAKVVLAALEDAAAWRREAIGNCPGCRSADEQACTDHQGSWQTAGEYDALRWQLDQSVGRADREAEPAPARPGPSERGGGPEPEEYLPPPVPGTSRFLRPEAGHAISGPAHAALGPARGPDRAPHFPPEEEAAQAKWPGGARTDPGPTGDQVTGWTKASGCEPGREAGE